MSPPSTDKSTWDLWRPYRRPEWAGWKVTQIRNGYLYVLKSKNRRAITFRSYESAKRRASELNSSTSTKG